MGGIGEEEEFERSGLGYTECLPGSRDAMASEYLGEPNGILISRLGISLAGSCFSDFGALIGEDDALDALGHDPLF